MRAVSGPKHARGPQETTETDKRLAHLASLLVLASGGGDAMAQLVVLHRVRDYQAWRQVYDAFKPQQQASGVTAESVYRAKDDPNNVLVLHSFRTMAEAEAFVANPELRQAMQRGGVEGEPRLEFFEEA